MTVHGSYLLSMAQVPTAIPDGKKIRQLIWDRGYSKSGFARQLKRAKVNTLYNIVYSDQRSSVALICEIARLLRVKPSEISDMHPALDDIDLEDPADDEDELRPTG